MSDLISRSTAMENYCNALCPKLQKGEYCNDCIVKAWLNNQPTAYSVDKVVEKLEELADENYKAYCIAFNSDDRAEYDAYTNAIEIVKQGGVGKESD